MKPSTSASSATGGGGPGGGGARVIDSVDRPPADGFFRIGIGVETEQLLAGLIVRESDRLNRLRGAKARLSNLFNLGPAGPGQRYASKGCYIVQLSKDGTLEKVSNWVVH